MVKSNAYGHGLIPISQQLEIMGSDYFGVFTIEEAIQLRMSGIKKEIILFGPFLETNIPTIVSNNISLIVGNYEELKILDKYQEKKVIKLHIKIDTGMGRIGFLPEEALEIIPSIIYQNKSLNWEGICTHFADSSSDEKAYTNHQGKVFNTLLDKLACKKIFFPLIHAANSAGILEYPLFHYNAVRPGILLYGIDPFIDRYELKPILSLKSFVSTIKTVQEGSYISYTRSFQTKKKSRIAIIPLGYADGYLLNLSNRSHVSIRNKLFPVIGNICMNQFVIDITDNPEVQVYDPVTLIDRNQHSRLSLNNLAQLSKTIPYEILCRLSESIPRFYI